MFQAIYPVPAAVAAVIRPDEQPLTVGDILATTPTDGALPRQLIARELALVEQSHEDFRAGRTYVLLARTTGQDMTAPRIRGR